MACPICGEVRITSNHGGIDVYACGFSSADGSTVTTPCRSSGVTCTCATHDLMARGCRCGAFQKEQAAKGTQVDPMQTGSGGSTSSSDPNDAPTGPLR